MSACFAPFKVGLTKPFPGALPICVHSDLEQLRKIRRRSPHDDTEAFTVFLRSDVEAKLVLCFTPGDILRIQYDLSFNKLLLICLFCYWLYCCLCVTIRALDVWGSHEALARERNLRKEVEREYQESKFVVFPGCISLWTSNNTHHSCLLNFRVVGNEEREKISTIPIFLHDIWCYSKQLFSLA